MLGLMVLVLVLGCKEDDESDPNIDGSKPTTTVLTSHYLADGGPLARAIAGDVALQNEQIRVVLQKPGRSPALNPYGGNIIDAGHVTAEGVSGDRFGEVGLFLNSAFTCAPEEMKIVDDGSSGTTIVRFSGPRPAPTTLTQRWVPKTFSG